MLDRRRMMMVYYGLVLISSYLTLMKMTVQKWEAICND